MNYHLRVTVDIKGTLGTLWYRSCLSSNKRKHDISHKIKQKTKIVDRVL